MSTVVFERTVLEFGSWIANVDELCGSIFFSMLENLLAHSLRPIEPHPMCRFTANLVFNRVSNIRFDLFLRFD